MAGMASIHEHAFHGLRRHHGMAPVDHQEPTELRDHGKAPIPGVENDSSQIIGSKEVRGLVILIMCKQTMGTHR